MSREEAEALLWKRTHDSEWMLRAVQAAVRKTLLDHKQNGDPIVGYRDGELAWIPADQIGIGKPAMRKRDRPAKTSVAKV